MRNVAQNSWKQQLFILQGESQFKLFHQKKNDFTRFFFEEKIVLSPKFELFTQFLSQHAWRSLWRKESEMYTQPQNNISPDMVRSWILNLTNELIDYVSSLVTWLMQILKTRPWFLMTSEKLKCHVAIQLHLQAGSLVKMLTLYQN